MSARGPAPDVYIYDATAVAASLTGSMETFTAGTYHVLLNAGGGTAVDMNGADLNMGVVGNQMHGGDDQKWELIPSGLGHSIRCAQPSADGHPLYLTVDGNGAQDGASVVAGTHPVAWNVEQMEAGIRCVGPGSRILCEHVVDYNFLVLQNLLAELAICAPSR